MNEDRFLEREVTSTYEATAPSREPEGLLDDVLLTTSRTRQRPRWLALIKEPSMRISSSLAVGSPTTRVAAIMVATLLLSVMIAAAGVAGGRLLAADDVIIVDQSGNGTVTTITEAVAMAADGDTILLKPGTYDESIAVTNDVTIRGDGDREDIVVEPSAEIPPGASCGTPDLPTAFVLEGSDATLENLTLRGESAGIVILGGAPLLQDVVLDGIGRVYLLDTGPGCVPTGLDIGEGSTATVTNSVLIDTDVDIETGASPSFLNNEFTIGAIWMQGTGVDPVIQGNDIVDSVKWGISIGGGARPEVRDNTIVRAQNGIEIDETGWAIPDGGTDPLIVGNTISDATSTGISMRGGATATIDSNDLTGNLSGISLSDSDATITGNSIQEGRTGVNLNGGAPTLENNTIEDYETGLKLHSETAPRLTGNRVCGNGQNIQLVGSQQMPDTTGNEICADAPEAG